MQHNVLIVGSLAQRDWEDVIGHEAIYMDFCGDNDVCSKVSGDISYSLVVFPMEGVRVHQIFEQNKHDIRFQRFWQDDTVKKVAWSMDSHHQWQTESRYQKFFDTYYIAHSNYMDKFELGKAKWLPCFLHVDDNRRYFLEMSIRPKYSVFDVVSIYRNYLHIGDRNAVMYDYDKILHKMGLNVFFGQTNQFVADGMQRYYEALSSGKIILNTSIKDDLNMRNIESLALNQVMLTNRVPDHEKMALDYTNTVFFDRYDMQSFRHGVEEAQEKALNPQRTLDLVINNHLLIHRYIEIFNNELGLNLRLPDIDVDEELEKMQWKQSEPVQSFVCSADKGDIRYDRLEMKIKGAYSYLLHDNYDKPLDIIIEAISSEADSEEWSGKIMDLMHLIDLTKKKSALNYKNEMIEIALWKCIEKALVGVISEQSMQSLCYLVVHAINDSNALKVVRGKLRLLLISGIKSLLQQKNGSKAIEWLKMLEAVSKGADKEFFYLAAEAHRISGNADAAIECYTRALRG